MSQFNVWFIFWCAVMMMQPWMGQGQRVKRSHVHAPAADAVDATAVASTFGSLMGEAARAGSGTTAETAKTTATSPAVVKSSTRQEAAQEKITGAPAVTPTTDTVIGTGAPIVEKTRLGASVRLVAGLLSGLRRTKRRLSLMNETLMPRSGHHKGRQASSAPVDATTLPPPFEFYSKMVSPKMDFKLGSPTMMTESVQQELDYQPQVVPQPMAEDFLLNEPENEPHGGHIMTSSKYHCMHKFSPALPPIFFMLQQLLQPYPIMETATKMHHSPKTSPLFEFFDGAEDMALQTTPNVIDHLLADRLELASGTQLDNKDKKSKRQDDDVSKKDELKKLFKPKEAAEVAPTHQKDEIVLVCPVHHEHHANRNGEIVDDDVILVDQCHVS